MRSLRRWRGWISGIMLLFLVVGVGLVSPLHAQSLDRLKQQQQQLQQQIQTTEQQLNQLRQQESGALQQMGTLRNNLNITNTRIADTEYRLQQAQKALEKTQRELQELEAKLERQRLGASARLRYLQRQGSEHWWALLLSSQDLNEFFDRRYQLKLLLEADRQLITELQKTAQQIQEQRIQLEAQKNEIALILQELAGQKNELEQQMAAQQSLIQRISNQRNAYEAAQRRLQSDSQQISGMIQQLIAAQTAQQTQSGTPIVEGTGRLIPPVGGPITSDFGWRVHPVYRSRRFHAGIDFGVPTGTPVRAADRGTVIFAGWYGGYGNTVIVNHGQGITTLYAHNSRLLVGTGQTVQRGQGVALAGSTGLSTGPHVHFEVRVSGQPVNPRRYL